MEIGRGGFGVVYRCTQKGLDRVVAVEVPTVTLDEESQARFFREQQAMGQLTEHPNIVHILQVGTTGSGFPYIVMPYHPRDSLEVRIRSRGPLPLDQALRLGAKIAGAVETAHRVPPTRADYIDNFYNMQHRHSYVGCLSPAEYEMLWRAIQPSPQLS